MTSTDISSPGGGVCISPKTTLTIRTAKIPEENTIRKKER
jgi:hypothetical protein